MEKVLTHYLCELLYTCILMYFSFVGLCCC